MRVYSSFGGEYRVYYLETTSKETSRLNILPPSPQLLGFAD